MQFEHHKDHLLEKNTFIILKKQNKTESFDWIICLPDKIYWLFAHMIQFSVVAPIS